MRRILSAIMVLLVTLVAVLAVVGCGDSGTEPATETVVEDKQVPDQVVDGDIEEKDMLVPAQQGLLYYFYAAIDRHDYQDAYGMCSEKYVSGMTLEQFEAMYREYIKSVKIESITPVPEYSTPDSEEYRVDFDAVYIKNYPAGSGELPLFHMLVKDPSSPGGWLLDAIGTGP
ncbi:MAG: DUF4829 domain-containing protein [Actinobacteria bacterium]|nr:DUF4829 domain-containing protein [Actinomycetota bacterium]MCG2819343.1 DUF4829 domain-containing protein [Actinomycetes bacterium]MBU4218874.1 DUF4829 domain-containing protein [Actinomycetota bacterium]MBU4358871.1 DUF4829 domain-containing protein [Actinomycetota bacterium]MBU4392256.1 DUF4829 domain-containing protein [Actinomycetota bacterium]